MNTSLGKTPHQLVQLRAGNVLRGFDDWYADDTLMRESRGDSRVGKAANRSHAEGFGTSSDVCRTT